MDLTEIKSKILTIPLTLLSETDLDNIQFCLEEVHKNNINGDFVETGVWKGGACIYAYQVLKQLNSNKKVFVADSFEGLPKPNAEKYPVDKNDPHWTINWLKIDLETVKNNFRIFSELDDSVVFLKGWFKDTMPTAPINKISVLRLDGDMYESTIDVLNYLYPKLSIGGYCIIDDFGPHGAHYATLDYRKKYNINEEIIHISGDPNGVGARCVYWKKLKEG